MLNILRTFKTLNDVAIIDNDGKVEIYAMVEDPAEGADETVIVDKLQTAFNIKLEK